MKKLFVTLLFLSYSLFAFGAGIKITTVPNPNDNGSIKAYQLFEIVQNKLSGFNNQEDKIKYLEKLKDGINLLLLKYEVDNNNYKTLKFLKFLTIKTLSKYSNPATNSDIQYTYPKGVLTMYKNGNLEGIVGFFGEKLKSDPFNIPYLINIVYAYYNLEKYEEALFYTNKILEIDKTNQFATNIKLKTFKKTQDYFGQIDFLENLITIQSTTKQKDLIYQKIAEIYLGLGDYNNSENYYKKITSLDNTEPLKQVIFERDKENQKIKEYENSNFTKKLFISWVSQIADDFTKEKKFMSALRFYNIISKKYNDSLEICDKKTKIFIILKQYNKALENINKCLEIKKTYAFYYVKGEILEKLNRQSEAIESYKQAINQETYHFEPFEKIAVILEKQNDIKNSIKYYEEAYKNAKFNRFYKKIQQLNQKIK